MPNQYLSKQKLIGDISIYSEWSTLEHIYDFPEDYLIIGTQFVEKFRELNFKVQGNKFFLIHFNRTQPIDEIRYERENKFDEDSYGRQQVNVGVNPRSFNSFTEKQKSVFIIKLIAKILKGYYQKYAVDLSIIDKVEALILKHGEDLEIKYKSVDTKKYRLNFSYQLRKHNDAKAIIEYVNKLDSTNNKRILVPLAEYEDIDHVIKNTRVIDGEVSIKDNPNKTSFIGNKIKNKLFFFTDRYTVDRKENGKAAVYSIKEPQFKIEVIINPTKWIGLDFDLLNRNGKVILSYEINTDLYPIAEPKQYEFAKQIENEIVSFLGYLLEHKIKRGTVNGKHAIIIPKSNEYLLLVKGLFFTKGSYYENPDKIKNFIEIGTLA